MKVILSILAGIILLAISLYLFLPNSPYNDKDYVLKTYFSKASGLKPGNTVLYANAIAGSVKDIIILKDSTLEINLLINKKMKAKIRKNAITSIDIDELMGEKIIHIMPRDAREPFATEGDVLEAKEEVELTGPVSIISHNNERIKIVSEELTTAVSRINNSTGFWNLLAEERIAANTRRIINNLVKLQSEILVITTHIDGLLEAYKNGSQSAGRILSDTNVNRSLASSIVKMEHVVDQTKTLSVGIDKITQTLNKELNEGSGSLRRLYKDTSLTANVGRILIQTEKATAVFNQNLEGVKSDFMDKGILQKEDDPDTESPKK